MTKFPERLKELREEFGFSQTDFAKEFNVSQPTIALWEQGKRQPDYETLVAIAKFFKVTTDYILGMED